MNAPGSAARAIRLLNQATFSESRISSDTTELESAIDVIAIDGYPITVPMASAPMNTENAAGYMSLTPGRSTRPAGDGGASLEFTGFSGMWR